MRSSGYEDSPVWESHHCLQSPRTRGSFAAIATSLYVRHKKMLDQWHRREWNLHTRFTEHTSSRIPKRLLHLEFGDIEGKARAWDQSSARDRSGLGQKSSHFTTQNQHQHQRILMAFRTPISPTKQSPQRKKERKSRQQISIPEPRSNPHPPIQ